MASYIQLWMHFIDTTLIGKTKPLNETVSDENLSVDVLANDAYNLLRTIFSDPTKAPSLLVCLTMLALC